MNALTLAHNSHPHSDSMGLWETIVHFLSDGVHLCTIISLTLLLGVMAMKVVKEGAQK